MLKKFGFPIDWILHQMGHENDDINRNHYTGLLPPQQTNSIFDAIILFIIKADF